jgi:hypothetical protein
VLATSRIVGLATSPRSLLHLTRHRSQHSQMHSR